MLLSLLLFAAPAVTVEMRSGDGLSMALDGIEIVRGSWFQVYEPDWSKGYYSSAGQAQTIKKQSDGQIEMSFKDSAGLVSGYQTYEISGNTVTARYQYVWQGDHPVKLEMAAGMIWSPSFQFGTLGTDRLSTRPAPGLPPKPNATLLQRRLMADSSSFRFDSPLTSCEVRSSLPLTLFDARGYGQDWAHGKQLWWLGALSLDLLPGKPLDLEVSWSFSPKLYSFVAHKQIKFKRNPGVVELANVALPVLSPKPKTNTLDFRQGLPISGKWSFDPKPPKYWTLFEEALARRFERAEPIGSPIGVHTGIEASQPGEYRLQISEFGVDVSAADDDGLRMALLRLASLAFARDGKLMLPLGVVADEPRIKWRAVHLFVGPKALDFHKKLWDRVLLPMGFNKVVLQCEQTAWKALPGTETAITMPRNELKKLFDYYRSIGVEPIPLIQSFGHMEWLFRNGKNLGLAYNPAVPYSLDVRKPAAQQKIEELWEEAIALLKPKTVHFGCDEVDMRGFTPGSEELVTQMWERHLPFLSKIAQRHNLKMMIWGDNALAPGEAVDATHAPNKDHAARRRAVIPKGTLIGDWHYRADANAKLFAPSLQLWKNNEQMPIAATWYRPENIEGFAKAAAQENAGLLQTTWAGYESSEENMEKSLDQFSAMVLAGEMCWQRSGRDSLKTFKELYYGVPSPLSDAQGWRFAIGSGKAQVIDNTRFTLGTPVQLSSRLAGNGEADLISIPVGASGSRIGLALGTIAAADEGAQVGTLRVVTSTGAHTFPLFWDKHVHSDSISAPVFRLPKAERIDRIEVEGDKLSGLTVYGFTIR
jgi:hypothetical protein